MKFAGCLHYQITLRCGAVICSR